MTSTAGRKASNLPKVLKGHKRQWKRCRTCGCVAYYDYIPYSLSNPIACMPCSHGIAARDMGADNIDEATALAALAAAKTEGA